MMLIRVDQDDDVYIFESKLGARLEGELRGTFIQIDAYLIKLHLFQLDGSALEPDLDLGQCALQTSWLAGRLLHLAKTLRHLTTSIE